MKQKRLLATAAALALSASAVMGAWAAPAVYLQEGSPYALVNGNKVEIGENAAPIINGDTTLIPLRFLSETLGKSVYWKDGLIVIGEESTETLGERVNEGYIQHMLGEESGDTADMERIRARLRALLVNAEADPTKALENWQEDGSFAGVEYFDSDRSKWNASVHLDYLKTMIFAAYSEGNPHYDDADLKEKIAKSLNFWVNGGRVDCDNWWYKEIGIPNRLVDILIFQPDGLTEELAAALNQQAAEGSVFKETISDRITERPVASTGANLTDKLITSFKIAVATGNEGELYAVLQLLENELRVFPAVRTDEFGEDAEGIKADYSFHQHVDQVQFGGYGEVFVGDVNKLLEYIKDTKYMISDGALNEYVNFLLDGMQWSFRGEYKDFTTTGRGLSRPDSSKGIAAGLKKAAELLSDMPQLKRYDELMSLKQNRLSGEGDRFSGNRHFWLSDYMAHKRDGYHIGIKIASNRTKLGEVVNNENLLGYYLSDGVTTLMQRGDEYENIYPVWDWNKLPGTTTLQGGLKNLNDWAEWNGEHLWNWKGNNGFVGGVSDGLYGAAVEDYTRDGMTAHKAWFLFDDAMVALGSGINSYTDMDVYTNLNQCLRNGDIVIGSNGRQTKAEDGTQTITGADYIYHDGIGYLVNSTPVELTAEERTGSWGTVNGGYADKEETKEVFQLGIHHGVKPDNASYAYTTVMNTTPEALEQLIQKPSLQVLRNDERIQAVYDTQTKQLQAVVWKADEIELPGGLTVSTNKKCLLMVKEEADGSLSITAANPMNEPKDLWVYINRELPAQADGDRVVVEQGKTTVKFRLNEGVYAGSSTTFNSATGYTEFKK